MQWSDEGIVLGIKRHGEANAVLELLTRAHGRHLGLVRGGAGSRLRPVLQPGNTVSAVWRARLDEHLGNYTVEGLNLRAASFMPFAHALYGVTHLSAIVRLIPERDPHEGLYEIVEDILDHLDDARTAAILMARFELFLLSELGFGLDLETCAATGVTTDLVYVSPKSGRAVSRAAGEPWQTQLFALPGFLTGKMSPPPSAKDLRNSFDLTGTFLARHILDPRGLDHGETRQQFIAAVMRAIPDAA